MENFMKLSDDQKKLIEIEAEIKRLQKKYGVFAIEAKPKIREHIALYNKISNLN